MGLCVGASERSPMLACGTHALQWMAAPTTFSNPFMTVVFRNFIVMVELVIGTFMCLGVIISGDFVLPNSHGSSMIEYL